MSDTGRFQIAYAVSGKSRCRQCKKLIEFERLRVGQCVQSLKYDGTYMQWFHYECFFAASPYLLNGQMPKSPKDMDGFDGIRSRDQQHILADIGNTLVDQKENIRKRALSNDDISNAEPLRKAMRNNFEEREMEKQNVMIFKIKDELMRVSLETFRSLFEIASSGGSTQSIKKTQQNVHLVADAMLFGVIKLCETCSGTFLYVSGLGYKCNGNFSSWAKCEKVTQDPARIEFVVPDHLRQSSPFLQSYKSEVQKSILHVRTSSTTNSNDAQNLNDPAPTNSIAQCESPISPEDTKKQMLWVTKSGAVDPESGLTAVAHVYDHDGVSFKATLIQSSTQNNKNSLYVLQILKHDQGDMYCLFRRWGRIGTIIGDKKLEYLPLDKCIKQFKKFFHKKTGNTWDNREIFVKHPGKMVPVDTDHGETNCQQADDAIKMASELPLAVQDLVELIFNTETMARVMTEYKLDLKKMPLGNLSNDQFLNAYRVLSTLSEKIKSTATDDNHSLKLTEETHKFYHLIPHCFGISDPPLLTTEEDIKAKCDMISDLTQMQLAHDLEKCDIDSVGIKLENPVDVHYRRLKTDITPLAIKSKMYKVIERYFKASTYEEQDLEIEDIFAVNRAGENESYKIFEKFPNRKLLWHGTRVTNVAGILSQGLRVAPPEAPCTGYMFGKGVYFADRGGKSAIYSSQHTIDPLAVLLLCEVALGDMYKLKESKFIKKLPDGKHSTMGVGRKQPDPTELYTMSDGVEVPYGKSVESNEEGPWKLRYNEYIVYNTSQIKVRYLVIIRIYRHT